MNSHEETFKDVYEDLAMYQASQFKYQEELSFNEEKLRSDDLLKRKLSTASKKLSTFIHKEVLTFIYFPLFTYNIIEYIFLFMIINQWNLIDY